jgi:hypothetical protein
MLSYHRLHFLEYYSLVCSFLSTFWLSGSYGIPTSLLPGLFCSAVISFPANTVLSDSDIVPKHSKLWKYKACYGRQPDLPGRKQHTCGYLTVLPF